MASRQRFYVWSDSSTMDTTHLPSGWRQNSSSESRGLSSTSYVASNQPAYGSSSQRSRQGHYHWSPRASGDALKAHKPRSVALLLGLVVLRHHPALIVAFATLAAGGLWLVW